MRWRGIFGDRGAWPGDRSAGRRSRTRLAQAEQGLGPWQPGRKMIVSDMQRRDESTTNLQICWKIRLYFHIGKRLRRGDKGSEPGKLLDVDLRCDQNDGQLEPHWNRPLTYCPLAFLRRMPNHYSR